MSMAAEAGRATHSAAMRDSARAAHAIVLEGINDIGQARQNASPGAPDLIAAHRQMIERAHARDIRIYGATLTPFEGAAAWTPEGGLMVAMFQIPNKFYSKDGRITDQHGRNWDEIWGQIGLGRG